MSKSTWNSDRIISICAILISLMTLVVFIYQTRIIQSQNRLSVLPYLSMSSAGTGTENYSLILKNDGVGPAFIKSILIKYQGKAHKMDLANFFLKNIPESKEYKNLTYSNLIAGQMIPANKVIEIFNIKNSREDSLKLSKKLNEMNIDIELVYGSIYGEEWMLSSESYAPIKLK